MSFTLPDFNLTVNIFNRAPFPPVSPRVVTTGNLAFSKRVAQQTNFWNQNEFTITPYLLLPALTDIRDNSGFGGSAASADIVEVPAASGRFYLVDSVDDIGKGFPNEHRCAILSKAYADVGGTGTFPGVLWPIPMP